MMKIGILTLPLHTNYGGILQAYALQTVLERMGHEVAVINYNQHIKKYVADPKWRRYLTYPWRFINKYILHRNKGFIQYEKEINKSRRYKDKYLKDFISQHVKYVSCDTLSELDAHTFDAIVVGSDQVWRKAYFGNSERIENAYLAFAQNWNIRRVAYAASFGKDSIDEYNGLEKEACKDLIHKFDAISVRENAGVDICNNEYNIFAKCVLDPTLLLSRNDYNQLIPVQEENKGDLFYYILDETPEILQEIDRYALLKKSKSFRINALPEDSNVPLEQRIQRPISEWLHAFASANEIITDSFHACVFSIIYNKSFWVLLNPNRGMSRIHSLLETFGLQDRVIYAIDELHTKDRTIDWDKINRIHDERRKDSIGFLTDSLKSKITPPDVQMSINAQ